MKNFPVEDVRKILDISIPPLGGICSFRGVYYHKIEKLIRIGAADPTDCQNSSPTISEFLKDLEALKEMILFDGCVVVPPRKDARVSIEGFTASPLNAEEALSLLYKYRKADECELRKVDGGFFLSV